MVRNFGNKVESKKRLNRIKTSSKLQKSNKNDKQRQNLAQTIENDRKVKFSKSVKRKDFESVDSSEEADELDVNFDTLSGEVDKQISDLISHATLGLSDEEGELIEGKNSLGDDALIKNLNIQNHSDQDKIDGFTDDVDLTNKILHNLREKSKELTITSDKSNKVHLMYSEIAQYMKSYKSGKLPKAMRMLPKLENWEELLQLTQPREWSNNAVLQTIKTFVGVFSDKQAIKYFTTVLLPAVRLDILQHNTLNCHLYMALKKAIYRPGAWIKSILLPLCKDGCTYKEASIIGSVLRRVSIPVMYAAAALVCICNCSNWYGSTSYLLTVLLGKKFALPKQAIEACVSYFASFSTRNEQMPVIWHQSLLTLVMGYKDSMTQAQINRLESLCKYQMHHIITPQILSHLRTDKENGMPID